MHKETQTERLPYEKPELEILGSFEELTRAVGHNSRPDGASDKQAYWHSR